MPSEIESYTTNNGLDLVCIRKYFQCNFNRVPIKRVSNVIPQNYSA